MPRDKIANPVQAIADLQGELAQCGAERDEALAQQTATSEVLADPLEGIAMRTVVRRIICCGGVALIAFEAARFAIDCRHLGSHHRSRAAQERPTWV
jgi:hypothetical protein